MMQEKKPLVAIDFETFYDSKNKYSLRNMTPWDYVHHEKFDPYLVSIHGDNDLFFTGDPSEFNWGALEDCTLVAHNMAFDGLVLARLVELGKVPDFKRTEHCTADMAVYFGLPRNLKGAVKELFGVILSKVVRSNMDGQSLADTVRDGSYDDLIKYAGSDAEWCYKLWKAKADEWPDWERQAAKINRDACWRGVRIDREAVAKGLDTLERKKQEAEIILPWVPENKPGSTASLSRFLKGNNVEPPKSYKKDGLDMAEVIADTKRGYQVKPTEMFYEVPISKQTTAERWAEEKKLSSGLFEKKAIANVELVKDVLQARLDVASLGPHIARLNTMLASVDEEDILRFSLKYFGTLTGRMSSGTTEETHGSVSIFNPLNLPKDEVFDVNLRNMLIPRKGYKFVIFDFCQIEARVIQWLAGNVKLLDKIRELGESIYIAYGLLTEKIKPEEIDTPAKADEFKKTWRYATLKATVLGLGFGMGAAKFRDTVERNSKGKMVLTLEETTGLVSEWRNHNTHVCSLWSKMGADFTQCTLMKAKTFVTVLPSGRRLTYFDIAQKAVPRKVLNNETGEYETITRKQLFASSTKGSYLTPLWGGILAQHATQATARDIMEQGSLQVCKEHPTWDRNWTVYDEIVFEVPDSDIDEALIDIPHILCEGDVSKTWGAGLPLAVDSGVFDRYLKM